MPGPSATGTSGVDGATVWSARRTSDRSSFRLVDLVDEVTETASGSG